jgi:hypothetical protein
MMPSPLLGLRWSIKLSFLDYIARAPGGRGALTGGALATDSREIVFVPDGDGQSDSARLLKFRGTVTFTAYSGALLVTVLDPFDREGHERLKLADFEVATHVIVDGYEHWAATNVSLASNACALFNNVYPPCTSLESLTIIVAQ